MVEIFSSGIQDGESREDRVRRLVRKASGGDEIAWGELHRLYLPLLSVVLHDEYPHRLRARFDTDDVLQSSFLAAFQRLPTFEYRDEESFRRWLKMVVVHKLRDRLRQHTCKRRNRMREWKGVDMNQIADESAFGDSPSRLISSAERSAQLLEAMSMLSETDQQVLMLRTLEKLPWTEVCARLKVSESTAYKRHREAIERLTRLLDDEDDEE